MPMPTASEIERLDRAPYGRSLGAKGADPRQLSCTSVCSLTPGSLPPSRIVC